MKPKDRVYAALRREPTDRVPIFMWFHPDTRVLLAELFEVPGSYVDVVLGNDVRMTWVNNNYCMEGIVHEHDGQGHVDPWGIEWIKEGPYNQIARFPLADASAEEVRRYQFPRECQPELLAKMEPVVADGGEVIIYAPHIDEISYTHGKILDEIGYHTCDYFLKQWDRFKDYPWGVLAHSTHVRGLGHFDAASGIEYPRVNVTLATRIPADRCRKLGLGYLDPDMIDPETWESLGSGHLKVEKAGEMLYRLKED